MLGSDYESFMRIGDVHVPVPPNIDIGHKFGDQVRLGSGMMHRDNVMVELCVDPVEDAASLVTNISTLVEEAEAHMSKLMGTTVSLSFNPVATFDPALLDNDYAQELGCDRDYLALYGEGRMRDRLTARALGTDRCAGGHIHLSYGHTDKIPEPVAVHFSDLVLGTLETTMGTQGVRRNFYGLHGLYRPKVYGDVKGVEYRTTSNMWLASPDTIIGMATNALSMEAVLKNESQETIEGFLKAHWPALHAQNTIASENVEQSQAFLRAARDAFPNYDWDVGDRVYANV